MLCYIFMGCVSGCLTLQGCYAPTGTPLLYLRVDSPFFVANLWIMLKSELCLLHFTLTRLNVSFTICLFL